MSFINDAFLLQSDTAQQLFHDFAKSAPIIDYHNHLSPKEIDENRKFENLTEAWLEGDHYKWRAMRANGVSERFITGDAKPEEKFLQWAKTVPKALRNPLYHWTHLELARYFNVYDLLDEKSSTAIYDHCSEQLSGRGARDLLVQQNVRVVCTTDDPVDSLTYHQHANTMGSTLKVLPTFRPDRALMFDSVDSYNSYLDRLSEVSGIEIKSVDDLIDALSSRVQYFDSLGCRLSDLGFSFLPYEQASMAEVESSFLTIRRDRRDLNEYQKNSLSKYVLLELGRLYHQYGWAQQLHLGALRNTNTRAHRELGPDTGFDSIGDYSQAESLSKYLDQLDNSRQLARTILYNLNPADNEVFATMAGNFNDGEIMGKIQYGSGWWFLDQKSGMEAQIDALSNMGLLSNFVGMLTDSRSFLSFPRHEYFRRILCNLLAEDVNKGLLPGDISLVGGMVRDICFNNANAYFGFNVDVE